MGESPQGQCVILSSGSESDDSDVEIVSSQFELDNCKQIQTDSVLEELKPKLKSLDAVNFKQCTITKVKNDPDPDAIRIVSVTSLVTNEEVGLSWGGGNTTECEDKLTKRKVTDSRKVDDFIMNPKNKITIRAQEAEVSKSEKPDEECCSSDAEKKSQFIVNPKRSFTVRTEIKTSSNVLSTTTSFNDNQVETSSIVSSESGQELSEAPQLTVFETKITNSNAVEPCHSSPKKKSLSTKKYAKLTKLEPLETKSEIKSEENVSEKPKTSKVGSAEISSTRRKRNSVGSFKDKENPQNNAESIEVNDTTSDSEIEEVVEISKKDPDESLLAAHSPLDGKEDADISILSDSDESQTSQGPSCSKDSFIGNPDKDIALIRKLVLRAGFGKQGSVVSKRLARYYDDSARENIIGDSKSVKELHGLVRQVEEKVNMKKEANDIAVSVKQVVVFLKSKTVKEERQLKYLGRLLKELEEKIKQLESKEVESDSDENNNPYVLLSKYKAKAVKVYKEMCKLEKVTPTAGRQYLQKFSYQGMGPLVVQKALEKYFNKTRKFPNFPDVLKLINKVNKTEKLGLSSTQIRLKAESIFVDFGRKLQQRRINDDRLLLADYLSSLEQDPAAEDPELARQLEENKKCRRKEEDVLDEFVRQQMSKGTDNERDNPSSSDDCDSQGEETASDQDSGASDAPDGEVTINVHDSDSSDDSAPEPSPKKAKR